MFVVNERLMVAVRQGTSNTTYYFYLEVKIEILLKGREFLHFINSHILAISWAQRFGSRLTHRVLEVRVPSPISGGCESSNNLHH